MERSNVSIIMRNKNEGRDIGFAIQSALDHIYKPEIIIVDNNSTDNSLQIARSFKESHTLHSDCEQYTDIKVVTIDDYSPGAALNLGLQHCTNDYILIMSAHSILTKFELSKLIFLFGQDPKLATVFGNQNPIYNGKRIQKRYIWSNFTDDIIENMFSQDEERYFLHNALAIYPKYILKNYPWDADLVGKEDRYWVNDMIENNYKSLYNPNIMACNHHYTPNGNTWKGVG
jgi:glycosyltransferase involved in cell wall biosynthesis